MPRILVWDMPVRLLHWLAAAAVLGAFALANLADDESVAFAGHALAGLLAVVVVALRLVWGALGTRYARFGDFSLRPAGLARYLRGVVAGRPGETGVGHNPATSWFALASFAGIAGLGVTGWLNARGSEGAEEVHEVLAWTVIALVALHVAGVLLHVVRRRENLLAGMVSGRKLGSGDAGIRSARPAAAVLLLGLVAAFGTLLVAGFDARTRRLTLPVIGATLTLGENEDEGNAEGGRAAAPGDRGDEREVHEEDDD